MRPGAGRDPRETRGFRLASLATLLSLASLLAPAVFAQARPASRPGLLNRGLRGAQTGRTPQAAPPQTGARPAAGGADTLAEPGGRSIEFNATPVDLVFKVYGELTDKTILKDPQTPQATITLQPRQGQELTDEDKIEAIETVLEMNGIHMEKYGEKFMRAIPRKEVRKEGIPLIMDPEAELRESTRVVSMMIPLKHIALEDAQKILDQFKSAPGILIAIERTNSILITDTEANINRMREIAKTIDIATPVTEVVEYIQIKNANANEIKQVIDSIVQESMKEQEKNGKAPQNSAQPATPSHFPGRNLLGRAGQQNQPAQTANQSLLMSVSEADRGMIRGKVVTIADERSNKILIITNASNMKFFKQVIEALDVETTPDTVVKVYRLKYAEAEDVSDMINDLIGNSVSSKDSKGNQNQNAKKGQSGSVTRGTQAAAKKPANQRSGETQAGELNKDNTTVLADKRINGLVVMTNKELVPTIEQIIESMDIKLSQVLIETTIIEVTLGDGLETGMDWVQKGRQNHAGNQITDRYGNDAYYLKQTVSSQTYTRTKDDEGNYSDWTASGAADTAESILNTIVGSGYKTTTSSESLSADNLSKIVTTITGTTSDSPVQDVMRSGVMNNWGGATSVGLGGGANGGVQAFNAASGLTTNALGKAFSFIFDSDELGLTAILQASKTDSHSKYIASPIVMTLDNKEATVEATSSRQFLTGWQAVSGSYAGSGLPSPNYTAKDIGIKLKITPKINPNGTVMLEVEEEYSQVSGTQTMLSPVGDAYVERTIDVPVTRTMSSDVLMENGQTVVFGGLTEKMMINKESGIPFLKDIPFIGKWLFGSVSESETRTELLVFMTPYVLDDAQAAQAEAIRRKKTMSDARPWDDAGWSASKLADPVSQKEQMRRIKDEWKKQDEERKTRIAIEEEKIKRAKKLEEMSKEERERWLKMHKKELDDEKQEELEKKMQDKESQEELKKLAADIRAKKLGEAEKALKAAEKETAGQNERARLDAEKKAAEEEKKAAEEKK